MSRYRKNMGDFGESLAAALLESKGYGILERQFHTKFGEIDIIAMTQDKSTIVFAEVKTRKDSSHGLAAESVGYKKLHRMVRSAQAFMLENPIEADIRFDVIEVYENRGCPQLNHIENAFPDLSGFTDF